MVKKIMFYFFVSVISIAIFFVLFLSLFEYRPALIEKTLKKECGKDKLFINKEYSVLSWNVGYASLGKFNDFFMSGGKTVTLDKKGFQSNLDGLLTRVCDINADINFIQEIDLKSSRAWKINMVEKFSDALGQSFVYAPNFKCLFVPYPIPPIGNVNSGVATYTNFEVSDSFRHALPVPFKWPVRVANLKRGMLVEKIPVYIDGEKSGRELVLVNVHLEAFDNGEAKIAQTKVLVDFINSEYSKGNFVIAGGDFNQTFPNAKTYHSTGQENWTPGRLEMSVLDEGWNYYFDDSLPTCRSTNEPYVGERAERKDWQYYLIDGFIASPNVTVKQVKVLDEDF